MSETFRDMSLQEVFFSKPTSEDVREEELKVTLYKNAVGYDYEEKTIEREKDGLSRVTQIFRKHIPSNPTLAKDIIVLMRYGLW